MIPGLICDLYHSSWQCQILNLLSKARDPAASSWILVRLFSAKPWQELLFFFFSNWLFLALMISISFILSLLYSLCCLFTNPVTFIYVVVIVSCLISGPTLFQFPLPDSHKSSHKWSTKYLFIRSCFQKEFKADYTFKTVKLMKLNI